MLFLLTINNLPIFWNKNDFKQFQANQKYCISNGSFIVGSGFNKQCFGAKGQASFTKHADLRDEFFVEILRYLCGREHCRDGKL